MHLAPAYLSDLFLFFTLDFWKLCRTCASPRPFLLSQHPTSQEAGGAQGFGWDIADPC